jgi:hypothetical protein
MNFFSFFRQGDLFEVNSLGTQQIERGCSWAMAVTLQVGRGSKKEDFYIFTTQSEQLLEIQWPHPVSRFAVLLNE